MSLVSMEVTKGFTSGEVKYDFEGRPILRWEEDIIADDDDDDDDDALGPEDDDEEEGLTRIKKSGDSTGDGDKDQS